MRVDDVMPFLESNQRGVLATLRANGMPQLSNIIYGVQDGVIGISLTVDRAKTRNLRRDPRASLHVTSTDFWSWVVVECDAELSPVAEAPGDPVVQALRSQYQVVNGDHPNWAEFEQAMVDDHRLLASLRPRHAYGQRV